MNITKIETEIQGILIKCLNGYPSVWDIIHAIARSGGIPFLVGGAVRDLFLGLEIKDLDIEIHNLSLEQLELILQVGGRVRMVGKTFGVLRIDTLDIDWSIPRVDTHGRKPDVHFDPHMGITKASARRDLTMNAMAIHLLTYQLYDPFDGLHDIKDRILRTPDPHFFCQDPLRFFRVMQFIGRFEMLPDSQLNDICTTMDIGAVSSQRIYQEFEKLLLKSNIPSLGIRWMQSIGRLSDVLPELEKTVQTAQNPDWHPEGSVFEHSMQALDAAAEYTYEKRRKLIIMWAALCHDLGKVVTTAYVNGVLRSYNHAQAGVDLAKTMLTRIDVPHDIIRSVMKLVAHHMAPVSFVKGGAKLPAYKRLASQLSPEVSVAMLVDLAYADHRARNPSGKPFEHNPTPEINIFYENAVLANILNQPEEPLLRAADIRDFVNTGPDMGRVLSYAYKIQIDESIADSEILKDRAKKYYHQV